MNKIKKIDAGWEITEPDFTCSGKNFEGRGLCEELPI